MKLSCWADFVTAVYSRLAVLSPSKQELGGNGQQLALHLRLHISSRLLFWGCFLSPCPCVEGPGCREVDLF